MKKSGDERTHLDGFSVALEGGSVNGRVSLAVPEVDVRPASDQRLHHRLRRRQTHGRQSQRRLCKKRKVFPHSLPSAEPAADPGVQAVSPQVT